MSGVDTRPMLALLQRHAGGCREDVDGGRCDEAVEYVLWGKLLPAEALGPRCYGHARQYVSESGLASRSGFALIRLGDLALDIALESEPVTDSTPPHSLEAEMATLGCLLIRADRARDGAPAGDVAHHPRPPGKHGRRLVNGLTREVPEDVLRLAAEHAGMLADVMRATRQEDRADLIDLFAEYLQKTAANEPVNWNTVVKDLAARELKLQGLEPGV